MNHEDLDTKLDLKNYAESVVYSEEANFRFVSAVGLVFILTITLAIIGAILLFS